MITALIRLLKNPLLYILCNLCKYKLLLVFVIDLKGGLPPHDLAVIHPPQ